MTFPKLSDKDRDILDLHLDAMTTVRRPGLVDLLVMGAMNDVPVVETPGKLKNAAWRTLHSDMAMTYFDESERVRAEGGSQVETVRAYVKRIAAAYREAFDKDFPIEALSFTLGDEPESVDIWRTK